MILFYRLFRNEISVNYGNCYSFNSLRSNESRPPIITSMTSPSFGLYLVLKLDQKNYMKNGLTKKGNAILLLQFSKYEVCLALLPFIVHNISILRNDV